MFTCWVGTGGKWFDLGEFLCEGRRLEVEESEKGWWCNNFPRPLSWDLHTHYSTRQQGSRRCHVDIRTSSPHNWIKFTFSFSQHMWASGKIVSVIQTQSNYTFSAHLCVVGISDSQEVWPLLDIIFFVSSLSRNIWQTSPGLRRPLLSYNKFVIIIYSHGGQGEAGSLKLLTIIQKSHFCWVLTTDQIFHLLRGCQMNWFEPYFIIASIRGVKKSVK